MGDIVYCAAFPKSGVTYLNFLLYYALFDPPYHRTRIERDYIVDSHAYPENLPAAGGVQRYVKVHSPFGPDLCLRDRADRAICLVRDPIDVMMSLWDYMHFMGSEVLWNQPETVDQQLFREFVTYWLDSGGDPARFAQIDFCSTWARNVASWLDQRAIPTLFVRYETLKLQPTESLARICEFIGRAVPRERLELAAENSSAASMRQHEQHEIDAKPESGTFYRPELAKAYDRGFRFIGKLHSDARDVVLTEAQRRDAERVFGSVLARVDGRIE